MELASGQLSCLRCPPETNYLQYGAHGVTLTNKYSKAAKLGSSEWTGMARRMHGNIIQIKQEGGRALIQLRFMNPGLHVTVPCQPTRHRAFLQQCVTWVTVLQGVGSTQRIAVSCVNPCHWALL